MSKTGQWIMDLEEESWDKIALNLKNCDNEQEAIIEGLKVFEASGLLGNYIEATDIEDAVGEMWNDHCLAHA
jgi:hypothetical protein